MNGARLTFADFDFVFDLDCDLDSSSNTTALVARVGGRADAAIIGGRVERADRLVAHRVHLDATVAAIEKHFGDSITKLSKDTVAGLVATYDRWLGGRSLGRVDGRGWKHRLFGGFIEMLLNRSEGAADDVEVRVSSFGGFAGALLWSRRDLRRAGRSRVLRAVRSDLRDALRLDRRLRSCRSSHFAKLGRGLESCGGVGGCWGTN